MRSLSEEKKRRGIKTNSLDVFDPRYFKVGMKRRELRWTIKGSISPTFRIFFD